MPPVSSGLRTAVWLGLVATFAVAAAGLIVALDHPATDAGRPELTALGDRRFGEAVAPARDALARLAADLDTVAAAARNASRGLRALDTQVAREAIADGDAAVVAAGLAADDLGRARDDLIATIDGARLSSANQQRLAASADAIGAAVKVTGPWAALAGGVSGAGLVLDAIARHDDKVFEATTLARRERYADALAALDSADPELAGVGALRDRVAERAPVPTLDAWMVRAADYDAALRRLYELLEASGGQATVETQAALAGVRAAQAALPAESDAFVIIVTEVAEPGLTDALVAIERARGTVRDQALTVD